MKTLIKHKNFICLLVALFLFAMSFGPVKMPQTFSAAAFSEASENALGGEDKSYIASFDSETIEDSYARRQRPDTFGAHDADYYPSVDNVLSLTDEKLEDLITESINIFANVESDIAQGKLKKHISADGQYYGTMLDDEPRITKTISINHMMSSRHWLGVFAPAGEVLTVTVDAKAIEQTKNNDDDNKLSIIIGYPFWENNVSKLDRTEERFSRMKNTGRMPYLLKEFKLTQTETKIGSPFGGMVFLSNVPGTVKQNFKITIDGGVDSPSYKLGVSQKSDWQKMLNSASPMAYIQTQYVNFMAPKMLLQGIEDPDNALTFWNNAAMLSNYAMSLDTLDSQIRPVIMMFDTFVPGGSALCYPGLFAAICPTSWIGGALNYKNLTTTAGGWGIIHEMNHNFQYPLKAGYHGSRQWSVGNEYDDYMEITNNVNNVMAFILYTDIAATRTETAAPSNGNWGVTVDPYYNLQHLLECSQAVAGKVGFSSLGGNRVYAYIDLVHSFGVDKFLSFLRQMSGGEPTDYLTSDQILLNNSNYMREEDNFAVFASKFFKRDMVDYFTKTLHFNLSEGAKQEIKNLNYKKHISLQNLYAMGETEALTGKPFFVDSYQDCVVLNLEQFTVTNAEHFEIKSVHGVDGGSFTNNNDGTYTLNFTSDKETFNIEYEAWYEGDTDRVSKTLAVCIEKQINFSVEATQFKYDKAADGADIKTLIQSKGEEDVERKYRAGNLSTSVPNGANFTRFKANVVFPQDQEVTFMVYGDDVTALKIGDQTAVCTTCVDYAYEFYYYNNVLSWKDNKIKVAAKANQPILLEAYCLNTGGGGSIKVSYSVDGGNSYEGIMLTDCVNPHATESEIKQFVENEKHPFVYETVYDLQDNALDRFYTNAVNHVSDIESVTAIDEQGRQIYNPGDLKNHKVENIYDGRTDTWFSVPISSFKLPHYYIFKFKQKISLNSVSLSFYNDNYAIRSYEYYIGDSENQSEWTHIFTGDNMAQKTSCEDSFSTVTCQYFIIKVTTAGTNSYTNFVEINFNQTLDQEDETNIYASQDEQFNYSPNWQTQSGAYINGSAKSTLNGEVSFILEGTDLLLYCENADSQVYIDNQKYDVKSSDNVGEPSLFVQGLSSAKHAVKIVGKNMVFDAIKTTGKLYAQTDLASQELRIFDFEYDGKSHKPKITCNEEELIENVDYVITSCSDGSKIGKVEFQIEGIGFYKGQINGSFTNILDVDKLPAEDKQLLLEKSYKFAGEPVEPKPTIKVSVNGEEISLVEGVDYDLTYSNNNKTGTATLLITFKGSFKGSMQAEYVIENFDQVGFIAGVTAGGVMIVGGLAAIFTILAKRKKKAIKK